MQLSTLEYLRRILYETEYIITEKEDFNEEQFLEMQQSSMRL